MSAELRSTGHGQTVLTLATPAPQRLDPEIYAAGIEALGAPNAMPRCAAWCITAKACSAPGQPAAAETSATRPARAAGQHQGLHDWIEAIRTYPKPVIAAVEGAPPGPGFRWRWPATSSWPRAAHASPWPTATWAVARRRRQLAPGARPARALAAELLMCGELVEAESACMRWAGEPPGRHGASAAGSPGSGRQLHGRAPQRPGQLKEPLDEAAHQPLSAQLDLERAHFLRNLTTPTRAKASPRFLTSARHTGADAGRRPLPPCNLPPAHAKGAGAHRRMAVACAPACTCAPAHTQVTTPLRRAGPDATMNAFPVTQRQAMDEPILTIEEREAINSGRWFSSLSPLGTTFSDAHTSNATRMALIAHAANRPRSGSPAPRARCASARPPSRASRSR
jgi:hypothetical protein